MPIILILALGFAGLVWLGRQAKAGKIKRGPWIKQGRAVSGFVALLVAFGGYAALMRGLILPGIAMIAVGILWLMGLKINLRVLAEKSGVTQAFDFKTHEAFKALGLPKGGDKAAIIAAWRDKMKTAHPDAGGTQKDAAKLNAARDHLLKRVKD